MISAALDSLIKPEIEGLNSIRHDLKPDPTFIPVFLTGGIGDIIISMDGIRELAKSYQVAIYTHHIEAFRYFYGPELPAFKKLPNYTWVLEFNTITKFLFREGFHGFLLKDHENLWTKQQQAYEKSPRLQSLVQTHFNKFFLISIYGKELKVDRRNFPMHSLGYENELTFEVLPKKAPEKYITIHDGFDIHNRSIVSGRATKQWKWQHWNDLVKSLKQIAPDYKVIQLGTSHTAREIDGVDQCLIDKTTITECFDILSKSSLHIDGDSGLVHAATRMQVPCVVLWGPTPKDFYGYKQNINLSSSVCGQACYGVKDNWNDKCVIGHPSPKCMDEINPAEVLEAILKEVALI